ncbi:MAG: hypothetical protein Q8Q12_20455 [bacterium]|nr:hypothetical protein [bacterium]
MNQMMIAAFQGLSHLQWWGNEPYISSRAGWRSFVDSVLITCVTGERPSDTDSGHHFQRMARQVLGIPEQRILSPEDTLREILNHGPRCVVFVDDFVGSGRQFRTTWARDVAVTKSASISFQKVASIMPDNRFFYCPLICTRHGERVVRNKCPEVEVCPAHFLEPEYGALSPDSFVWPDHLRASAYTFLEQASARAGIADTEWRGIDDLGLVLAFEHSVPDAALKMIYWEKNNWKPLVRRK